MLRKLIYVQKNTHKGQQQEQLYEQKEVESVPSLLIINIIFLTLSVF